MSSFLSFNSSDGRVVRASAQKRNYSLQRLCMALPNGEAPAMSYGKI